MRRADRQTDSRASPPRRTWPRSRCRRAPRTHKSPQKNEPRFDARAELYRTCGVDLTQVPGLQSGTALVLLRRTGAGFRRTLSHRQTFWLLAGAVSGQPHHRRQDHEFGNTRDVQKPRRQGPAPGRPKPLSKAQNYFGDLYRRWKARLGTPKAITAMAHKLARILWHLFKYHQPYDPSVWAKAEAKLKQKKIKRLQQNAAALGFKLLTAS